MAIVLLSVLLGGLVSLAAALVFPYRVRFLRARDRYAFILTVLVSGTIGATAFGASGVALLLQL